jgi:sugar/nucleoside kinase (ribokinase family)
VAFLGVYGHVNVDHLLHVPALPASETTVPVNRSMVRLGGTAGNIASGATAMGVPTALASVVGSDFPPEFRRQLSAEGLDVTDVHTLDGPTPRVWVLAAPGGAHAAIIDQGVMGDAHQRPSLDYAWLSSTWVHFTTGNPEEWLTLARQADEAGKRVTVDPAQELGYRYSARTFERLLEAADLFVCNEHELPRALRLLNYGDPVQLLDHVPRILETRGVRGLRFLTQDLRLEIPACPLRGAPPTDATGAGDVLRSGLYAALHRGEEWSEALRAGATAAALFLEAGGERFPSWDDVRARRDAWHA